MNSTPDESFIPLTPVTLPAQGRPDCRVTVMSQSETAHSFTALGQTDAVSAPAQSSSVHEPRVSLQRDGDRVSAIRIQCACGWTLELACAYEPASTAKSAPTGSASAPGNVPAQALEAAPGVDPEAKPESAQTPVTSPKTRAAPQSSETRKR